MKTSRNDPCPCGSGKKFKKCCAGRSEVSNSGSGLQKVPLIGGADLVGKNRPTKVSGKYFVSPGHFFSSDAEKTKLNWFLFEFALETEHSIGREKRLKQKLRQKGVDDSGIGEFCVHYAKQMKEEILGRVAGRTLDVRLGYEQIEAFFPQIGDRLVDQLLTVVGKAWESQTDVCVRCPTRCISERDERALMFDDPYYWE